jgi:hypothetical protein
MIPSDKLLRAAEAELLKGIPACEHGARSPHEIVHAMSYIVDYGCHLIPSRGLLYSNPDRESAFNNVIALHKYAKRFEPPNYLIRCEPGDSFICIRIPDRENLEALESLVGRLETVSIMSTDGGESFMLFRAPRPTAYEFTRDIDDTECRVSRFAPLPGALCRRTNRPFQYARFLAPGEIRIAPLATKLAAVLPRKSLGLTAAADWTGSSERTKIDERKLQLQRQRRKESRERTKAPPKPDLTFHQWRNMPGAFAGGK